METRSIIQLNGESDIKPECAAFISSDASFRSIIEMGVRDGIDLRIRIPTSLDIATDISLQYVWNVLIPAVESNRMLPGCWKKPSILFCDNCRCYWSDEFLPELANHGILPIKYLPDTSHLFQVLNVLLFPD
jgi:hypothetical protein